MKTVFKIYGLYGLIALSSAGFIMTLYAWVSLLMGA